MSSLPGWLGSLTAPFCFGDNAAMSLILDALKKSEADRRLGQAPGLSSTFPQAASSERGPLVWSLALLVLVSLAALWHNRELLLGADQGPVDSGPVDPGASELSVTERGGLSSPVAGEKIGDRAAKQSKHATPVPATASQSRPARDTLSTPTKAPLPMPRPQALPPVPIGDPDDPMAGVSPAHRQAIERGELVVPNPQILAQRGPTAEPQIVTAEAALPPTIETPAAVETEDGQLIYPSETDTGSRPRSPKPTPPGGQSGATATGTPSTATNPVASADTRATPVVGGSAPTASAHGVPLIYDLSLSQRQGLPELKMSMHVYHRDAARRFVIIDGRRLNENDPIGQLLWARAIVPEGVIIEYRDLRFLLPRPGG